MTQNAVPMERRLRIAGTLLILGLAITLASLMWGAPLSSLMFAGIAGSLIIAGILIYLYGLVSPGATSR
jgi:hypothetical protein